MAKTNIGGTLLMLNNSIRRQMENCIQKREIDRITGTNGWIIGYIADNSDRAVYQRDLEKKFGITRSTASKNIDLMVQKGLIERRSVDFDARLKRLVLTDKAQEITARMNRQREEMEEKLTNGFSDEELVQLNSYLSRIIENIKSI